MVENKMLDAAKAEKIKMKIIGDVDYSGSVVKTKI